MSREAKLRSVSPTHLDRMLTPMRKKKDTLRPALLALAASALVTSNFLVPGVQSSLRVLDRQDI